MAQNPHDSGRKDELITGHRIQMNIYDRQNEVRGKIYSANAQEEIAKIEHEAL